MKISNSAVEVIKQFEGYSAKAYKCPAGVWTIGYGTTKYPNGSSVKSGDTCTMAKATVWLKNDIAKFESCVDKYDATYHFNQNQYDALVCFAYNVGSIDGLTAKGTRTIAEIATKIPAYNKACGKVLSGLVKRRTAERKLFVTYPSSISSTSSTLDICWMQGRINKINTGLNKINVDGDYGVKTKNYVLSVWRKWGWTPSSGRAIGAKTIARLKTL